MRLTLRFLYWVSIALALYTAFSYFRLPVFRLFFIASLAILLFSILQVFWNARMIELTVKLANPLVPRGQNARWFLQLHNKSRLSQIPIRINSYKLSSEVQANVRMRHLYGNLDKDSGATAVLSLNGRHCGVLRPEMMRIAAGELFGFFYLNLPSSVVNTQLPPAFILPLATTNTEVNDESLAFLEGSHHSQRPFDESEELEQVRALRIGDPLKRIHWKVSARVSEWMVKQYRPEDDIYWTLLCDVQTLSESENKPQWTDGYKQGTESEAALGLRDYALDSAAALLETALLQGRKLELRTYHPQQQSIKGGSLDLYPDFLKQLASLPAKDSLPLTEQLRREITEAKANPYLIVSTSFNLDIFEALQIMMHTKAAIFFLYLPYAGKINPEESKLIDQLRLSGITVALNPWGHGEPGNFNREELLEE